MGRERERHSERKTYTDIGRQERKTGARKRGEQEREGERERWGNGGRERGGGRGREKEQKGGGETQRGIQAERPRETERREMENLMSHQDTVSPQERVREGWVKGVRGLQSPLQKCTSCQPQLFRDPAVDNNARLFKRLRDHYLRGETFS